MIVSTGGRKQILRWICGYILNSRRCLSVGWFYYKSWYEILLNSKYRCPSLFCLEKKNLHKIYFLTRIETTEITDIPEWKRQTVLLIISDSCELI